jgi:hypothetical protein
LHCKSKCWPKYDHFQGFKNHDSCERWDNMWGQIGWLMGNFSIHFPVWCERVNNGENMMKMHWLVKITQMLLVNMRSKCTHDPLLAQVWTQVSLALSLKVWNVKGQIKRPVQWTCISWLNQFWNFCLISNDKNHSNFLNKLFVWFENYKTTIVHIKFSRLVLMIMKVLWGTL